MLQDDLHMYYGSTYVGYMLRGKLMPFYVEDVRQTGINPNNFTEEAVRRCTFMGRVLKDNGDFTDVMQGTVEEGTIVLDMQELGFTQVGDSVRWLSWRPNRSTKKGLCGRRVDGFGNNNELNRNFVIGIFKSWRDKSVMERMFHVDDDGNLLYKNFQIGTKNRTGIKLKFKFAYLMLFVNRVFADVPVAVMEEGENA